MGHTGVNEELVVKAALSDDRATPAEHKRFLSYTGGDEAAAQEMIKAYLNFRSTQLPKASELGSSTMPRFAQVLDARDSDGQRVLYMLGAMYDSSLATQHEYTLALARLLDQAVSRDSDEKVSILIECRGAEGFANPTPWTLVPWWKELARTLPLYFPERLVRLVLTPTPWIASTIWSGISQILDERTADKIRLVSGPTARDAPMPDEVANIFGAEVVAAASACREATIQQLACLGEEISANATGGAACGAAPLAPPVAPPVAPCH